MQLRILASICLIGLVACEITPESQQADGSASSDSFSQAEDSGASDVFSLIDDSQSPSDDAASQPEGTGEGVLASVDSSSFLPFAGPLSMTGSCDDADGELLLEVSSGGLQLSGLASNPPIFLEIDGDHAYGGGAVQFGKPDHAIELAVTDEAQMTMTAASAAGSCSATLAAFPSRCAYDVSWTNCPFDLLVGDVVCMPCGGSCPHYANKTKVFAGKPVRECTVQLARRNAGCVTCNGKPATPVL